MNLFEQKIKACYEEYKAKWLRMQPAELIERCEEIEAVTRMARELPSVIRDDEAAFLMQFKNPLEVVSDEWISRNGMDALIVDEEMNAILFHLINSDHLEDFYEMEPQEIDDFEQILM